MTRRRLARLLPALVLAIVVLAVAVFAPWWVAATLALLGVCLLVLLRWTASAPSQDELWPSGVTAVDVAKVKEMYR